MDSSDTFLYIDSDAKLQSLCKQFQNSEWLAIDTEFLREKTYYPKFCLIQIANSKQVACVDPLALHDLEPLIQLIYNPAITKIFHAGRQDMEIFYNLRGTLPSPIFDTQTAAPLLGFAEQIGYAGLVLELLGITLSKAHTRTDWSQRPLSREQLRYASDDVLYLGQIYLNMYEKLLSMSRLEWLVDDFAELMNPEIYQNLPELAWRKIRGVQKISGQALTILKRLAQWREEIAQRENLPRNWVIKDDVIINLARSQPESLDRLKSLRGLQEKTIRKYGETICRLISDAKKDQIPDLPLSSPTVPKKTAQQDVLINFLTGIVHQRAKENSLNPGVLAPKKDLERLVFGQNDTRLLQGWRKKIVGDELSAVLRGEHQVYIEDGMLKLTPKITASTLIDK